MHATHARTHTHTRARAHTHTHTHTQVLSHQYKIASKLELFVGTCSDGDKMTYQKCKWKRLGYLSLDNNERSSWQVRARALSLSLALFLSFSFSLSLFLSLSLSLCSGTRAQVSAPGMACFTALLFTGLLVYWFAQARELKSVHLDAFGRFLKVAYIYPPHTLVA